MADKRKKKSKSKPDMAERFLGGEGLPIPGKLDAASRFPADLTQLNDVELRQQMSYWANHLARAEHVRARWEGVEINWKFKRDKHIRRFRLTASFKTKWEAEAALERDEVYAGFEAKYQEAHKKQVWAKGVRDAYEHYWSALSRELSGRIGEVEREGRGASAALESRFGG